MKLKTIIIAAAASIAMQLGASWVDVHVEDAMTRDACVNTQVGAVFSGLIQFGDALDERYYSCTDKEGNCNFHGTNSNPHVSVLTGKMEGCYSCRLTRLQIDRDDSRLCVTLAVQRIVNPIPLYARTVEGYCPDSDFFGEGNDSVSYDLILDDWLPPQGTGTIADIVFTRYGKEDTGVHTNVVSKDWSFAVQTHRYPLKIAFPGRGNGVKETTPLAGSGLRIREAPEEGYNDFVMSYEGKGNDGARFTTWDGPSKGCYCFRIRSEFDESGKLKSCLYGKVYDGFWFDYVMKKDRSIIDIARLKFTYYLNKTPLERNLEYDSKRNLNPDREFRRMAP